MRSSDADYWRREAEENERRLENVLRAERDQQERQRNERNERAREWQSTADSWEEAFPKAISRYASEVRNSWDDASIADFFSLELKHTEEAWKVYQEQMELAQVEIEEVLRRVRAKTVEHLRTKFDDTDKSGIVLALEENNFEALVDW